MSVLIKGMEMPEMPEAIEQGGKVPYIDVRIFADGTAVTSKCERPYYTQFAVIPVPDHGDLIDRGYAIATACSGRIRALPTTEDGENWIRVDEVRESIKSAPTIIPADLPVMYYPQVDGITPTIIPASKEGEG